MRIQEQHKTSTTLWSVSMSGDWENVESTDDTTTVRNQIIPITYVNSERLRESSKTCTSYIEGLGITIDKIDIEKEKPASIKNFTNWLEQIVELIQDENLECEEGKIARRQAVFDATWFISQLPLNMKAPVVSGADDGEIALKWKNDQFKAVISFEGDKWYGYALYENGIYKPGKYDGVINQHVPKDLEEYLCHFIEYP